MIGNLSKEQKKLIVNGLKQQIADLKKQIHELEDAIIKINLDVEFEEKVTSRTESPRRQRLGVGVPRKWVFDIFAKYKEAMTIGTIIKRIEIVKGRKIGDSTARRGITKLEKEGIIHRLEDGSWEMISKPLSEEDDGLPF